MERCRPRRMPSNVMMRSACGFSTLMSGPKSFNSHTGSGGFRCDDGPFRDEKCRTRETGTPPAGAERLQDQIEITPQRGRRAMGTLDGQVAIITGGTRGIGRATAELFAAHGATLALCSRIQEALDVAAKQIGAAHGTKILARSADILDPAAMADFVQQVGTRFGRV